MKRQVIENQFDGKLVTTEKTMCGMKVNSMCLPIQENQIRDPILSRYQQNIKEK